MTTTSTKRPEDAEERRHIKRQELHEIADGARGHGPFQRGIAREELNRMDAEDAATPSDPSPTVEGAEAEKQRQAVLYVTSLAPKDQFRIASLIAENVGYVLEREPEHPDSPHAPAAVAPLVYVNPMALSDSRTDYFVTIKVSDREVTPHVFREEYKAAYHVALYDWLLNGSGEEPDVVEFNEQDWPAQVTAPAVGAEEVARAAEFLKPFVDFAHSWRDIPGVVKTYPDVELWQKPGWVERSGINVGHLRAAAEAYAILALLSRRG